MKIYCLFLLPMFFYVSFVSGMELSLQASWNNFSNKVIMHIAASLENQQALFCVNKRLSAFVTMSLTDAVNNGNYVVAEFLLKKGASVNARDKVWGQTALIRSIETDQYDIMQLLFYYKADPNAVNAYGCAPLHKVVKNDKCVAATLLLDKGALVDVKNIIGSTPLMLSVRSNNLSVAAKLKDKNCDRRIGSTFASFKMTELLLNAGADPNVVDYDGDTALKHAVCSDNMAMIDLLVRYGANPYLKNLKGHGTYWFTSDHDILQLLNKSRNVKK